MAIRFRGFIDDFSKLEHGQCPPQAHQLDEEGKLEDVLTASLKQSGPIFILMFALALVRFNKGLNWQADFSFFEVFLGGTIAMALYTFFIYLHEIIHAWFCPIKADKDIWIYQMQAALVYCNAPMSRMRFIVMSLAPTVILGFLPYSAWLLFGQYPSPVISIYWMLLGGLMVFGGIGDFYNVRNVWNQVPKNAMVFNYGIHTYWIDKGEMPKEWK